MKKLTLGSFKREGSQGSFGHRFFTKLEDGREVDLESCLNGYCVAIYDKDLELIGKKVCTNLDGVLESQIMPGFSMMTGEALEKAIKIANKLLNLKPQKDKTKRKGDFVEFRPIVTGKVYHKRNGVIYIEFNGGKGYLSPPYIVKKI